MSDGILYVETPNPQASEGPPPEVTLFPDPSQPASAFGKITVTENTAVKLVAGTVNLNINPKTASPQLSKKLWDKLQTDLSSGNGVEVKVGYDANGNVTSFASQQMSTKMRLVNLAKVTAESAKRIEEAHVKLDEIRKLLTGGGGISGVPTMVSKSEPPPKSAPRMQKKKVNTVRGIRRTG